MYIDVFTFLFSEFFAVRMGENQFMTVRLYKSYTAGDLKKVISQQTGVPLKNLTLSLPLKVKQDKDMADVYYALDKGDEFVLVTQEGEDLGFGIYSSFRAGSYPQYHIRLEDHEQLPILPFNFKLVVDVRWLGLKRGIERVPFNYIKYSHRLLLNARISENVARFGFTRGEKGGNVMLLDLKTQESSLFVSELHKAVAAKCNEKLESVKLSLAGETTHKKFGHVYLVYEGEKNQRKWWVTENYTWIGDKEEIEPKTTAHLRDNLTVPVMRWPFRLAMIIHSPCEAGFQKVPANGE